MSEIKKKSSKSKRGILRNKLIRKYGLFEPFFLDSQPGDYSQPVITGIVNELTDYCVRPGLIIASSIINDIIDELKTKSNLHSYCQLSRKVQIQ